MNIIVVGDASSTNLGDPILTYCTEYLLKEILKEQGNSATVKIFDIAGRPSSKTSLEDKLREIDFQNNYREENSKASLKKHKKSNRHAWIKWVLKERKKFRSRLMECVDKDKNNVFVIAGGALISRSLFYSLRLNEIVATADKIGGKVIFNAVGVEKCTAFSFSRKIAKRFLNRNSVVAFSTRDNCELDIFEHIKTDFHKVSTDSGMYSAETYDVRHKNSDVVGIGAIHLGAYQSVSFEDERAENVSAETLFEFWNAIIVALEKRGQKWKMFVNGGVNDCRMAYTFLKKYGYSVEEYLMTPPEKPAELVEQISQFKSIVAHRLHALIIATSLEIPVVPVVWSSKVENFARYIGNDNYCWPDASAAEKIADFLCDEESFNIYSDNVKKCKVAVKDFLEESLKKVEKR